MANVVKYKEMKTWGNAPERVEIEYDFAKDAGAVAALGLFKTKEACVVELAYMKVKTTCTSGGSATVSVGNTGDVAGMIAATAVASLVAGAVIYGAASDASHKLAADDVVVMDTAVAALTAGKIVYVFDIYKF